MSEKKPNARKHYFVDPKVQGALILRVVLYWFTFLFGIMLTLLCWQILTNPVHSFYWQLCSVWSIFGPTLAASLLLLPLVIVDLIRFSNRFVGPLLRLRRSMRELSRGQYVEPLEFRANDFWREVADEFNSVSVRIQPLMSAKRVEREKTDEPADEPATVG